MKNSNFFIQEKQLYLNNLDDDFLIKIKDYLKNLNVSSKTIYKMRLFRFYLWIKYYHYNINKLDINEYIKFLKNPDKNFIGEKKPFYHPDWRPFFCELKEKSITQNLNIIKSFLNKCNIELISPIDTYKDNYLNEYTLLNKSDLENILEYISLFMYEGDQNKKRKIARLRWTIVFIYFTGIKITSILNIKMNQIYKDKNEYYLNIENDEVVSKIKLSDVFLKELISYKKIYNMKNIVDKYNEKNIILSLSGKIDLKINTLQKEIIKLKTAILEDEYFKENQIFLDKIKNLSLNKIREYSIITAIQDKRLSEKEIKKFYELDNQTYKKYSLKEMNNQTII